MTDSKKWKTAVVGLFGFGVGLLVVFWITAPAMPMEADDLVFTRLMAVIAASFTAFFSAGIYGGYL